MVAVEDVVNDVVDVYVDVEVATRLNSGD